MPKVLVFYYSQTGNTEKMAKAVIEGAQSIGNVEVDLRFNVDPEELSQYDAIIIGVPTYHHSAPLGITRVLEEAAVKRVDLKGKIGATFGSYGWSGEAPRYVQEILKNRFEMQVYEPPLIAKYAPDQNTLNDCRNLGKRIVQSVVYGGS
jgi:flavorubredoxin